MRDYARFGEFILGGGRIDGAQVLPAGWVQEAGSAQTLKDGKRLDYGFYWWIATPTPATPDPGKAFYADGIFGQYIYLNPREQVVVVVWSARSKPEGMEIVDDLDFFGAVTAALH